MAIREIVVTKQLIVDPSVEREQGVIQIPAIPLNQYSTPIAAEAERFGAQSPGRDTGGHDPHPGV